MVIVIMNGDLDSRTLADVIMWETLTIRKLMLKLYFQVFQISHNNKIN